MGRIASALTLFLAIFLIVLGMIFLITGELRNLLIGGAMIAVSMILLLWTYKMETIEASRPKVINQTFKVRMGGSGRMEQRKLACKSCGAGLEQKDITVVDGGLTATCPYCGSAHSFEEAPKW